MGKHEMLVVMGSPRKQGNSAALANQVIEGAQSKGARVDRYLLSKMDIHACIACNGCRKEKATGCVVDDEMQSLYPKLRQADSIVIASPIYWFSVSAQTKAFIDRWYALNKTPGTFAGKKIAMVLAFADPDVFVSGAVNALRMCQDICGYLDARYAGAVYGRASEAGKIKTNEEVMAAAYALGEKLVGE
jgi:multimeric flavodoxin WrbA